MAGNRTKKVPAGAPKATEPAFEAALEQLEALVEKMESGELPLDQLVQQYSDGTKLLKICQKRLKEAELKIDQLRAVEPELVLEPFEPEEAE